MKCGLCKTEVEKLTLVGCCEKHKDIEICDDCLGFTQFPEHGTTAEKKSFIERGVQKIIALECAHFTPDSKPPITWFFFATTGQIAVIRQPGGLPKEAAIRFVQHFIKASEEQGIKIACVVTRTEAWYLHVEAPPGMTKAEAERYADSIAAKGISNLPDKREVLGFLVEWPDRTETLHFPVLRDASGTFIGLGERDALSQSVTEVSGQMTHLMHAL